MRQHAPPPPADVGDHLRIGRKHPARATAKGVAELARDVGAERRVAQRPARHREDLAFVPVMLLVLVPLRGEVLGEPSHDP